MRSFSSRQLHLRGERSALRSSPVAFPFKFTPLQKGFLILLIPLVGAIILFFPHSNSTGWMDTALDAIEYRDAERLDMLVSNPDITSEDLEQFIATLEEDFWPLIRYTPTSRLDPEVEVIAQVPEIEEGIPSTKLWVAVMDGHGRKGIFTIYATPDQEQILALELLAEPKP